MGVKTSIPPNSHTSTPAGTERHTVIIVGGGPAGLPLGTVLAGGLWPYYHPSPALRLRHPRIDAIVREHSGSLLGLPFRELAERGVPPVELFNTLHHPTGRFPGLENLGMEFRPGTPLDCLVLTRESVGGLWNHVPRRLLTLSPGHWMEFAFYPLAQWAGETGREIDPDALIVKQDLVAYYHAIPERFGVGESIRTGIQVVEIRPCTTIPGCRFLLRGVEGNGAEHWYACRYLVYAAGQRCTLRRLGVPGEDLPYVVRHYDTPESLPGERIMVVGGGRSSDWAATELHDAGRDVLYVMRQPAANHWRLIGDSRGNLPYYARIAELLESGSPRLLPHYETQVERFEPDGTVHLLSRGERRTVCVDRVLAEIGGEVDYRLFQGFPPLTLVDKYDRYRFQCRQMQVSPESCESVDIPGLYAGGYLASGINNVVVAMHGATYVIAGDILRRESLQPVG